MLNKLRMFATCVVSSLKVIYSRSEWICLKRYATLPRYVYQAQGLYETTKLAYCIKPQTQWALSPLLIGNPHSPCNSNPESNSAILLFFVEHRENRSAQRQPNKISGFLQNDKSALFAALASTWSGPSLTVLQYTTVGSKATKSWRNLLKVGRKLARDKYYTDQKVTRLTQIYTYIC